MEVHKAQQNEWKELREILQNAPESVADTTGRLNLYYLTKLADIFPVDVDVDSKEVTSFNKRLR